jgi:hypothetical protein
MLDHVERVVVERVRKEVEVHTTSHELVVRVDAKRLLAAAELEDPFASHASES